LHGRLIEHAAISQVKGKLLVLARFDIIHDGNGER
jgi:hypothetical protein